MIPLRTRTRLQVIDLEMRAVPSVTLIEVEPGNMEVFSTHSDVDEPITEENHAALNDLTDPDVDLFQPTTLTEELQEMTAVGGVVFDDVNGDGLRQEDEEGIPDALVRVFRWGPDNTFHVWETTTDANGAYHFEGLEPGNYIVEVSPLEGYSAVFTGIDPDSDPGSDVSHAFQLSGDGKILSATFSLAADIEAPAVNFAFAPEVSQPLPSVGGVVFDDVNGDGLRQEDEEGIPDALVRVFRWGPDNTFHVWETTTDANGAYHFEGLEPGNYIVEVSPLEGLTPIFTGLDPDSDPTSDVSHAFQFSGDGKILSATFSIATGTEAPTVNFAFTQEASEFQFTNIGDNTGEFEGLHQDTPSINNAGMVAYVSRRAIVPDEPNLSYSRELILRGDGESLTVVADEFQLTSYLSARINDAGTVAGIAGQIFLSGVPNSVFFVSPEGELSVPSLDGVGVFEVASLNNTDMLAYFAGMNGPGLTLRVVQDGEVSIVFDTVAGAPGPFENATTTVPPSINDDGLVVFTARLIGGSEGLFLFDGTEIQTVLDDTGPIVTFEAPVINGPGTIAFVGEQDDGGRGIFLVEAGEVIPVVNDAGPFADFGRVSITDGNVVAFEATLNDGRMGIFLGPDPMTDTVIMVGDDLFGSTVTSLTFGPQGLNEGQQVAFGYALSDGRNGVAMAELM